MSYQDTVCVCRDCGQEFAFSADLQRDYKEQGFKPPTRCSPCHVRRSSRRSYSRGGDCEMHTAPCSVCGKTAKLPFQPTDTKPVYCDECFKARSKAKARPSQREFAVRKPEKMAAVDAAPAGDCASFSSFRLDQRLQKAIREAGYEIPTPVQLAALPIALAGRDIIGTAQTGTGKTAAFVLPILQHLLANPAASPCTRVVVLTPTRELAEQVNDVFNELGKHTKIRSATVYGGVGMNPQEKALRDGTEVIVACPGRLLDHIGRGTTKLSNVDCVVLDEADRMLDMGFLPSIKRILSHLPRERQTMLFSATFAPELMDLASGTLRDPQRVEVDICAPPKAIAHALYPCPQHLKTSLVLELLDKNDANSVLIFTRTKHRANRLARQIETAGYGTAALHSNRSQNQRQLALDSFRSGECQILVATDIAARGLDVETISHVINYDIPETADTYIHRIGRTGRMEREGDAITLVTAEDAPVVFDIEKALGGPIDRCKLDNFDYNAPAPPRSESARGSAPRRKPAAAATGQAKAKPAAKSPGYFASQRKYRSKKADG